ncbi:MAG: DUF507 family protein [Bdellovibrionaceae bacterium]|nr:DUF507 family protein [Pseudobdellovibrionaceae bacterium]
MKVSDKIIQRLVNTILRELKEQNVIQFKTKEEIAFQKAVELVKADFHRESRLDMEVNNMMDDLERQNPGSFQRYKMFPLLKKKLAKDRGIVL